MHIKAIVSYEGTQYGGWQLQKNAPSVQGMLEKVLFSLVGRRVVVHSAGRTDAGVHAKAMPVHFDLETSIPPEKLPYVFNTQLPKDIRMLCAEQKEGFHAQYHAKAKQYVYSIWNSTHASAMFGRYTMHFPYSLDIDKMRAAAAHMVGQHDFSAFAASGAQVKTTVRTVYAVEITKKCDCIRIAVTGNGFLYNMVRIITGTLLCVGTGRIDPAEIPNILASGDRARAGFTAEPQGLVLKEVYYEDLPFMEDPGL